jgi:hypothetical protein
LSYLPFAHQASYIPSTRHPAIKYCFISIFRKSRISILDPTVVIIRCKIHFCAIIGQFPTSDGLFERRCLAYFRVMQLKPGVRLAEVEFAAS